MLGIYILHGVRVESWTGAAPSQAHLRLTL